MPAARKTATPAKATAKPAATAKAAPAARKATAPKATTRDEAPDLLAGLVDDSPAPSTSDDGESFDLLDGLTEDNGTPWIPDDPDDPSPEGIQGRVTYRGTVPSDFGPEECPLVELESPDGTVWSIRGYATVLRNQIDKANPQVGDIMAARYFGPKMGKSGKEYKNYKVATAARG